MRTTRQRLVLDNPLLAVMGALTVLAFVIATEAASSPPASAFAPTAPHGAVFSWGLNTSGQLGDGTTINSDTPVQASLPTGLAAVAVAAGAFHSLALTSTGSVYAWGQNADGQLGDGTTTASNAPIKVGMPTGVKATAIAAGWYQSLALVSTGSVYAWGDNGNGELGIGTVDTTRDTPVKVSLPAGVTATAIAGGAFQSLALASNGSVYAWGYNNLGQLGDGTTTTSDIPVKVSLPSGVTATAIAGGYAHGLAVTSTGSILAWGWNASGQLGNGTTTNSDIPVKVTLPAGVVATGVAGGSAHSLAVTSAGAVYAWGRNVEGELGNSTTTTSDTPVKTALPRGVTAADVGAGWYHSLALASTGSIYAWGWNGHGQLGDGTTDTSDQPVRVTLPAGVTLTGLAGGSAYSLAVTSKATTVPARPAPPTMTAGNASVTAKWKKPATRGSPITRYVVTSKTGAHSCTWTSGPRRCTIGTLVNGKRYKFRVVARNAVGTSTPSKYSKAVTPVQ
jgi:alpha-tubulin suppressor-like RCC1 family protein